MFHSQTKHVLECDIKCECENLHEMVFTVKVECLVLFFFRGTHTRARERTHTHIHTRARVCAHAHLCTNAQRTMLSSFARDCE